MSKVGSWSTNAGGNNSTPPDGWPEGQAPSTINDCAREMMASIRTLVSDLQYVDLNNTPSFLTATTFSMGTADVTNFHVGRRVKLFDATTLYGTIDSVSSTFVSVRLDSGALTASLTSMAVAALTETNSALPESVWNRKNIIINGGMNIWQRGATFQPANNATTYTADRWAWIQSSGAAVNITRSERSANATNVPTIAQAGVFLTNSLCISISAVDAAIAAGEFALLVYRVEGYDWRQIAHKPNVLSFWASTNRTGTYAVSLRSIGSSASYVANYTLSAASTWTRFSITVPEAPTTNVTWNYSESTGVIVSFAFAAGATYQAGAGNWTAANALATSSQVNFLATATNVFRLTGVQLEYGSRATPLENRHYLHELQLCQRYYWRGLPCTDFNFASFTANVITSWPFSFHVPMRIVPTMGVSLGGLVALGIVGDPSAGAATVDGFRLIATASGAAAGNSFTFTATNYIDADAEF